MKCQQFKIICCYYSIVLLVLAIEQSSFGQSGAEGGKAEQTRTQAQKIKSRPTWEKIISFPGKAIFFPFKIILKGTEKTIAFVDDTHIIPRVNDLLESDDGLRKLEPTYSSSSGGGFNLYQKSLLNPESKLTLTLAAGMYQRQKYQLEFKNVKLFGCYADFLTRYQLLSDEEFCGLGPNSNYDSASNYAHEMTIVNTTFGREFSKSLSVYTLLGFEFSNILESKESEPRYTTDLFTNETLPGIDKRVRMGYLQASIRFDSRNRPGNPTAGNQAFFTGGIFQELGGDQFGFRKAAVDFTQYVQLFYGRTLVLRVAGELVEPLADRQIPFYYLGELGRRETIRGFERGRFRDRDMLLGTAEYRYPLSQNEREQSGIEALLFVDGGQVSPNILEKFSTDDFTMGVGAGIRFYNSEGIVAKVEFGKSRDEFRVYFVWNE